MTDRRAVRIRDLWRAVEDTGLPGVITGLHSACVDCDADGELVMLPGRRVVANIFHDTGCPAYNGVVDWRPVPITEGEDTA